jgi:alcohol dehydrogenase
MQAQGQHYAIVTLKPGGLEVLSRKLVPTPPLGPADYRVKVLAAGCNNTDINTRIGWYDKSVTTSTDSVTTEVVDGNGYGDKPTPWPLVQGTDCAGVITEVGADLIGTKLERAVGKRCLVASNWKGVGWFGSDFAGGFQELVTVPHQFCFPIDDEAGKDDEAGSEREPLSDEQLGAIPCAYGTAENMLLKVGLKPGDVVVVPGASGGVGGAVVELAGICRDGIRVVAIVGKGKGEAMRERFGGYENIEIHEGRAGSAEWGDLMKALHKKCSVVVDNVGGSGTADLINALKPQGRYVTSGAIAGPVIEIDLRTLYLNDITMHGSTTWVDGVMENLVRYIEEGKVRPRVSATFPLERIGDAQEEFGKKGHIGKIVLVVAGREGAV